MVGTALVFDAMTYVWLQNNSKLIPRSSTAVVFRSVRPAFQLPFMVRVIGCFGMPVSLRSTWEINWSTADDAVLEV